MPKFLIELTMDGYETPEEEEEACKVWIEEQLDSSGTSVKIICKWVEDEEVNKDYQGELFDADPNCKHELILRYGGGVKCRKCGGWYCYQIN